jgi:hypothetical protein
MQRLELRDCVWNALEIGGRRIAGTVVEVIASAAGSSR